MQTTKDPETIRQWLREKLAERLGVTTDEIETDEPLTSYGIGSVEAVSLSGELEEWLGRTISPTLAYDYPTIDALANHLAAVDRPQSVEDRVPESPPANEGIAIVGIGCRFPGARNTEEFWQLLRDAKDAVGEVPRDRWDVDALYDANPGTPGRMITRWGGFLDGIAEFDCEFFGISPREAARMDPQQRLLLEATSEALEDASLVAGHLAGTRTGVFIGISSNDYGQLQFRDDSLSDAYAGTGNALSIAANRISYLLDLHGPSLAVDAACSSSLVAAHLACESLRRAECQMAIVGGVNVILSPMITVNFSKAGFMAPDGRCKAFDARANGYVRGEGAGVVVLKPLGQAMRDGDPVYAVIRGSAVNQDGRTNGLTAPNGPAQSRVLREAYRSAQISPGTVQYLEAHGTGTSLGDPIEVKALGEVLREGRVAGSCALGSVKTNIGHLEAAAGIAGLIKVALALEHRTIPASLHFHEPNPHIPFEELPLHVQARTVPWPDASGPAVAGVSSFGFGGTNAHVVVAEAPAEVAKITPCVESRTWHPRGRVSTDRPFHLLPLSAKTAQALVQLAGRYAGWLDAHPDADLGDVCFTAGVGRSHFEHRAAVVVESREQLQGALEALASGQSTRHAHLGQRMKAPKVAMLFTGQGSQYRSMGQKLYDTSPAFKETLDRCAACLEDVLDQPLVELLFEDPRGVLNDTRYTQPALFAVEAALYETYRSAGIEPTAVMGHSVGEYAAAYAAGILTLEDGLRLVARRGELFGALPAGGAMVAVAAEARHVEKAMTGHGTLSVAAYNGSQIVLSGAEEEVAEVIRELAAEGIRFQRLETGHAFHSRWLEPALDGFEAYAAGIDYRPAERVLISNLTGEALAPGQVVNGAYWRRHAREAVQFEKCVKSVRASGCEVLLEVGPKPVLLAMALRCWGEGQPRAIPALRENKPADRIMIESMAALYAAGCHVDFAAIDAGHTRRKLRLPTYPFQRQRYWVDLEPKRSDAMSATFRLLNDGKFDELARHIGLADDDGNAMRVLQALRDRHEVEQRTDPVRPHLYRIAWRETSGNSVRELEAGRRWLIVGGPTEVTEALIERLRACGQIVTSLSSTAPPAAIEATLAGGSAFDGVIQLAALDVAGKLSPSAIQEMQSRVVHPTLQLVQAMLHCSMAAPLYLVTRGAQAAIDDDLEAGVAPQQTILWGFGKALGLEHPELFGKLIDLAASDAAPPASANRLLAELAIDDDEDQIAVRGQKRLAPRLERLQKLPPSRPLVLRDTVSYLITGGLGALGLAVCEWLAEQGARHIVLIARRAPTGLVRERITMVQETHGCTVVTRQCDVAESHAVDALMGRFGDDWPPLGGVIHAAGVLDDGVIADQTPDRFERVMRPKVDGAYNLHNATRNSDLDFFVLYSSLAAALGGLGQSNYAAANAFLDGLGEYRRALDMPATAIDYGPWAGDGMADARARQWHERVGVRPLSTAHGLGGLGSVLTSGFTHAVVADIDWSLFSRALRAHRRRPLLADLENEALAVVAARGGTALLAQLGAAPRSEWRQVLVRHLQGEVREILGLADPPDPGKGFFDLGMDSLMGLELRNRLETALGPSFQLEAATQLDHPTIERLAAHLSLRLSEETELGESAREEEAPAERSTEDQFPLSEGQAALWFMHQLSPGSTAQELQWMHEISDAFDLGAAVSSCTRLVERHGMLRAHIDATQAPPTWKVSKNIGKWLTHEYVPSDATAASICQRLQEAPGEPFALDEGPVFRIHIYDTANGRAWLRLSLHHIAGDGWSMGILLHEWLALYRTALRGEDCVLTEIRKPFSQFVAEERLWLESADSRCDREYWINTLTPARLKLPMERREPAIGELSSETIGPIRVETSTSERLRALCRERGVTMTRLLLAAYALLLHRLSGQDTVVVGTLVLGRPDSSYENTVGYFINMIPLRTVWKRGTTVQEWLEYVDEVLVDGIRHSRYPLATLIRELSLQLSPPVQTTLRMLNESLYTRGMPARSGSRVRPIEIPNHENEFPLSVEAIDEDNELSFSVTYQTRVFDRAGIEQLSSSFERLLQAMGEAPEQVVDLLPLLTDAEKHRLLGEWNDTAREFPADRSFHELFEEQVELNPDSIAAVFPATPAANAAAHSPGEAQDVHVSYRELNLRANRLAHHLRGLGAGPDAIVAILMERSVAMLEAILAAFKSGAAYLPLDVTYPTERLDLMVRNGGARILVTTDFYGRRMAATALEASLSIVRVDVESEIIAQENTGNAPSYGAPQSLAYIIHTSGSTGIPKGAMVEQRGMLNHLYAKIYELELSEHDVVAQTASPCFDISVWQFLVALLVGGRVHILGDAVAFDPVRVLEAVERQQISIFETVPSMLQAMLLNERAPRLGALRWLIATGEALPPALCRRFLKQYPDLPLLNAYGPTECSDDVTHFALSGPPTEDMLQVPVGHPLANVKLYVTDTEFQPVPLGVAGELSVGGLCVGRGYHNDTSRTVEVFRPDPFSDRAGARLYRTGDLTRWLPDGNVQFLGRLDHQIKIRGVRVELGEIEAVLASHPDVREAAVTLQGVGQGQDKQSLVAFLVARGADPGAARLRTFLAERLPAYMLPQAFVVLDALPLTPSGKIDRNGLPEIEVAQRDLESAYVAPRTDSERRVAGIWQEVLGADRVGVEDNFFELGGHSLIATRVIAQLNNAFQVDLPLRVLFESPTVAQLAAHVTEQRLSTAPPLVRVPRGEPLPLSFAQQRLWFIEQLTPGSPAYHMPGAVRVTGELQHGILSKTINEIVRRHEALRTTFRMVDGEPRQIIAPALELTVPALDLRELPASVRDGEARRVARAEALLPFDLSRGPLLRVLLVELGERNHIGLFTMHHIVSDGWSMAVLIREVSGLYEAFASGASSPLPELEVQYADFAAWQRQWLEGEVLDEQVSFWKEQLAGAPALLDLPADRPRPPVQTFRGALESVPLSQETTEALKQLSRCYEATPFMTLLAVFQLLLSRLSGQEDIVVGAAIANRNRLEVGELIGFFMNALALRTRVVRQSRFVDLLARVRETSLTAFSHQDVPFEKVVEELRPARDLSYHPLFQVLFDMVQIEAPPALQGFEVAPVFDAERTTAKFDLTLYAPERDGQIVLSLAYSSDLFDAPRIVAMLHQLRHLLAQIVADPERQLGAYTLVAPEHRGLLPDLREELDESFLGGVHDLFAMCAGQDPSRTAVVDVEGTVSYGELDRRSNQLAHYLAARGIERGDIVALYGHRSSALVWALLGVLKAGAAFTILDPAYPCARLSSYLEEAKPKCLLQVAAAGELPEELGPCAATIPYRLTLPPVKDSRDFLREYPEHDPGIRVSADDPAFVAFTSGSTGEPKGVLGRHGPLTHFLPFQKEAYGFEQSDRFILLSGLAYNHLQRDVFTPLCIGGRLYIPSDADVVLPERIVDWVEEHAITVLNVTPGRGQLLHQAARGRELASLRVVFFGGDALKWGDVKRTFEWAPHATVVARYGATETQRAGAHFTIPRDTPIPEEKLKDTVPLGRGVRDAQYLVLDSRGEPAGVGELGELCIRSPHLALGYLNDESLTQARFVSNPHTGLPQDRWYRTGEYARYLPDGNVQFVSRDESRVNIRGFRVELGEVENWLERAKGVAAAVAVAHDFGATPEVNDLRLVAYVVEEKGAEVSPQQVRTFLKDHLPDYMVPSHVELLENLPLTPNGKVDRAALPAPVGQMDAEGAFVAPETRTEEKLAAIWREILQVDRVGAHDDFFELGGHSLLATQVISRVNAAFGAALPLRDLFESPSLARLAERIDDALRSGQPGRFPPIEPLPPEAPLPLSYAQEAMWHFSTKVSPEFDPFVWCFSLQLSGPLNVEALRRSLEDLIHRHEGLRTSFVENNSGVWQYVHAPAPLDLPVEDCTHIPAAMREQELRDRLRRSGATPLEFHEGPPSRITLIQWAENEHTLNFHTHHLLMDGWSTEVIHRDLAQLYGAYAEGREASLPALPLRFADFAAWQRSLVAAPEAQEGLKFWSRQLEHMPPPLRLPFDRPPTRRRSMSPRGTVQQRVSGETLTRLKDLCDREQRTLYSAFLACFIALLRYACDQEDVLVVSPHAGRSQSPHLEQVVGMFADLIPIRTNLTEDLTFRSLLSRVQQDSLEAFEHQPFFAPFVPELSGRPISPNRRMFPVTFSFRNFPTSRLQLSGLAVEVLRNEGFVDSDLMLVVTGDQESLQLSWIYDSGLFDAATIERMAEDFRTLTQSLMSDPDAPLHKAAEASGVLATAGGRLRLLEQPQLGSNLTARQAAIWLGDQLRPDLPGLTLAAKIFINGPVDGLLFDRALHELVERSDMLQAVIVNRGFQPRLVAATFSEALLEQIDFSTAEDGPAKVDQWVQEQMRRRFDVSRRGFQAALIKLADDRYCAFFRVHHALMDGVSMLRASDILADYYEQLLHEQPLDPETLPAFADYVGETRRYLGSAGYERDLGYWRQKLSTRLTPPRPYGVPLDPGFATIDRVQVSLGTDRSEELRRVATEQGVSLASVLGALTAAYVAKVSGIGQLAIGIPIHNRRTRRHRQTLGVFAEILPLHLNLANGDTLLELVAAFQRETWEVTQHAMLPLGKTWSHPTHHIEFNYHPPAGHRTLGGFPVERQVVFHGYDMIHFGVRVLDLDGSGELRVDFDLHAEKFPVNLRRRVIRDFLAVVDAFLIDPLIPCELPSADEIGRGFYPAGVPSEHAEPRSRGYVAPRNSVEEQLCSIWADVLKVDRVGVYDDFFELGGHSLLATQIATRVQSTCNASLPLRDLFDSPTVARVAELIAQTRSSTAPALVPIPRDQALPLSFAQQRLWFADQFAPGSTAFNLPAAVRATGPLNASALGMALAALVRRHEVLRTTFASADGRPEQVIGPEEDTCLPVIDLKALPHDVRESEASRLAALDANTPFDLGLGPMMRVKLVQLAGHDHVLISTFHHIATDHWSMRILADELAALYVSFSRGEPPELPPLPIQYADFAAWQRAWLTEGVLEEQLTYWREKLAGHPRELCFPKASRSAEESRVVARQPVRIPARIKDAIKSLANETRSTSFMVLLAAFEAVICRYTGETDLWVGTPIANRARAEIEHLVGFFVNTLILRTNLSETRSFGELLSAVRQTVLEATQHQDLPYDQLVARLAERRHHPGALAQVYFAFYAADGITRSLEISEDLHLSRFEVTAQRPGGGLTLFVTETPEEMVATFTYSPVQLDADTLAAMAQRFLTVLDTVTANPAQQLVTLPPFPETAAARARDLAELYTHSNLTMNQLTKWMAQKLRADISMQLATTIRLHTAIDPGRFNAAFATLVNSSDSLRSVITEPNGLPQREVHKPGDQPVEYIDFSDLMNPDGAFRSWLDRRTRAPLEPAVRSFDCVLIRVGPEAYVWYLNLHPIFFDEASRALIIRYMADLYQQSRSGRILGSIDLPPYENYTAREREYRGSQDYEDAKAYWDAKLAGGIEPIAFYGKRSRKTSGRVQSFIFTIEGPRAKKLEETIRRPDIFSRTANVTLFNIFASVLCAYLRHASGNDDFWFASSFRNRQSQDLTKVLGLFAEVHPLRVSFDVRDTFASLAKKIGVEMAETLRHGEYSTELTAPSTPDAFIGLVGSNYTTVQPRWNRLCTVNVVHYASPSKSASPHIACILRSTVVFSTKRTPIMLSNVSSVFSTRCSKIPGNG